MIVLIPAEVVTPVAAQPTPAQRRQVTLTQTITNGGSVRTAVVTLDRGGPPTDAPAPPSRGDSTSSGLTQEQLGIILGCTLGALTLLIIVWFCVSIGRRRRPPSDYDSDSYMSHTGSSVSSINPPRRTGWPQWRSIPPPVVPTYRARPRSPGWRASRRASMTERR